MSWNGMVNDMRCPNCNSKDIGKIGSHQFYCWGCFIELTVNGDKMSVYQVEEDGTLSSLDDLFFGDDWLPTDVGETQTSTQM